MWLSIGWSSHRARLTCGLFIALSTLTAMNGCSDPKQKFIPTSTVAEKAITSAMDAWKAGQPSGVVANTSPAVHVTDTNRKASQSLVDYKILGEKPSTHGRTFMVELKLASPDQVVKAEYIIVGIDPLWVFRRDDYELLMHWDHHMPPAGATPAPGNAL